jgi:prophage antirepressor-like protein
MNELIKFDFKGNIVRTITIDNEPWFVAKDVCNIFAYVDTKQATRDHVEDEDKKLIQLSDIQEGVENTPSHMKGSKIIIINESGLYTLIFGSKLEKAKIFKKWITSEVLPSIRKTGSYSVNQKPLSQIEILQQSINFLAEQQKQISEIDSRVKAIEERPAINAPIEHFSIMGYCHNIGKQVSLERSRKLSYRCRSLCLELGLNIGKVSDSRYGTVNTYPLDVLKEIIGE